MPDIKTSIDKILVNKIFKMIVLAITKIVKILCYKNLELYGMYIARALLQRSADAFSPSKQCGQEPMHHQVTVISLVELRVKNRMLTLAMQGHCN